MKYLIVYVFRSNCELVDETNKLKNLKMEMLKNLENPNVSDEQKAKFVNEISETFDSLITSEGNQAMIECYLNVFINFLQAGEPQFFSESPSQKVNKILTFISLFLLTFVF